MRMLAVVTTVLLVMKTMVMAQGFGLQVGDTAVPMKTGVTIATVGAASGQDFSFYGLRGSSSFTDDLSLFLDMGMSKPDYKNGDAGFCIQSGVIYNLMQGEPCDIAIRATIAKPSIDRLTILNYSYMALASKRYELGFTVFGGLGMNYLSVEYSNHFYPKEKDTTERDVAVTAGVIYQVNDDVSIYAELSSIDGMLFGGGLRTQFN